MCVPEGPLWAYSGVWTILSHPQSLLTLQTSAPTGWLSISGPGADREPGRLTLRVGLARARGPYSGTQAQHTPYTLAGGPPASLSRALRLSAHMQPHTGCPRAPTFSPLMKRSFSLRFT